MSHFGPAVSHATAKDPLLRMRAYQVAADLLEAAWHDAKKLSADRARFFEYALSSARESISWYQGARPVLGDVVPDRLDNLEEIRRLLIATIPRERATGIRTKA